MSDKPSYLGLLNAIAVGEAEAHCYLSAWIETTTNADVCAVLSTVAAREGEHGMSFAKRIDELGYTVRPRKDDGGFEKRLAIARSSRSDLEKMEKLGFADLDTKGKPDFFDTVFTDHSIDIATGALLGRYIAEERDSARQLSGCYEALKANAVSGRTAGKGSSDAADDRLVALEAKLDQVCAAVSQLSAALVPAANGRSRPKAGSKSKA
jgi:hypothetical protein